jgi:hypothetical protein
MPKISDFFGPKPTESSIKDLELIAGNKPCSKCDKDAGEAYWDPSTFTMLWTCPDGHENTFKVN